MRQSVEEIIGRDHLVKRLRELEKDHAITAHAIAVVTGLLNDKPVGPIVRTSRRMTRKNRPMAIGLTSDVQKVLTRGRMNTMDVHRMICKMRMEKLLLRQTAGALQTCVKLGKVKAIKNGGRMNSWELTYTPASQGKPWS